MQSVGGLRGYGTHVRQTTSGTLGLGSAHQQLQAAVYDDAKVKAVGALAWCAEVVDRAASLGVVTLVGPSKGDVTTSDGVPTTATTGQLVALATQFVGNKNVGLNAGGLPANNGFQTATGCQLSAASGLGRVTTLRAMRLPQQLDGPSWWR